jgi:hypothetical protein
MCLSFFTALVNLVIKNLRETFALSQNFLVEKLNNILSEHVFTHFCAYQVSFSSTEIPTWSNNIVR